MEKKGIFTHIFFIPFWRSIAPTCDAARPTSARVSLSRALLSLSLVSLSLSLSLSLCPHTSAKNKKRVKKRKKERKKERKTSARKHFTAVSVDVLLCFSFICCCCCLFFLLEWNWCVDLYGWLETKRKKKKEQERQGNTQKSSTNSKTTPQKNVHVWERHVAFVCYAVVLCVRFLWRALQTATATANKTNAALVSATLKPTLQPTNLTSYVRILAFMTWRFDLLILTILLSFDADWLAYFPIIFLNFHFCLIIDFCFWCNP